MKGYMLSLHSPRWAELKHASGSAADIPALLAQLRGLPASDGDAQPWGTLWGALAHQLSSPEAARAYLAWQLDP